MKKPFTDRKLDRTVKKLLKLLRAEEKRIYAEIEPQLKTIEALKEKRWRLYCPPKLKDLAFEVLQAEGRPLHYTKIMERIEKQYNIKIPGKDPKRNFVAHLANNKRIERVGWGVYGVVRIGGKMQ
uniref:Putative restriction endonuclease n=1 Tax=viral metagenome TaxID=1070528 RepID=A0A6H1ZEJ6_9ZZZZ